MDLISKKVVKNISNDTIVTAIEICINKLHQYDFKIEDPDDLLEKQVKAYQYVVYKFLRKMQSDLGISRYSVNCHTTTNDLNDDLITIKVGIEKENKEKLDLTFTPKQSVRSRKLDQLLL